MSNLAIRQPSCGSDGQGIKTIRFYDMKPANNKGASQGGASKTVDKFTASSAHQSTEGIYATSKRSGSKPSVEKSVHKQCGPKRGARSMGRYPFLDAAHQYLEAMKGLLAEPTWIEYERRLRRMDKDFRSLVESNEISKYNPWKMTEKEILAYLRLLKARGLKPSGISHNIDLLNSLLHFIGNGAMDMTRMRFAQSFPKRAFQRYDPISDDDLMKIIHTANEADESDWQLMLGYGITVIGICTGLRPKELRLATISDLNLIRGTIHTEHVKGEDSYGLARDTGIHPDGIPFLKRYVKARASVIANKAPTCEALFPAIQDIKKGGDGYYSPNSLTKLRAKVTAQVGVKFDNRACRRTFGQMNVNMGVPIDSVSRMMGHSSTKTTEKYYCRKTTESAISDAQKVWGNAPKSQEVARLKKVNTPLIENRFDLTGYG
jgi:integrase/recombinase XerD